MEKMTKGSWMILITGIVVISIIITAGILLDPVSPGEATNIESQKELQTLVQRKLYKDHGFGVMAIYGCDTSDKMECGYSQWKEDYPERAKKIVASTIGQCRLKGDYFVLIYETE